jgi:hypothetical protein
MTSVIGPVRDVLTHTGLLSEIGESQIYLNVYEAISQLDVGSSDVK